jgi:hypothetical protein
LTFLTVAVFSTVLLAFQPTRLYGVIGWALLLLAYSYWTLGVVLAAGVAYYMYQRRL